MKGLLRETLFLSFLGSAVCVRVCQVIASPQTATQVSPEHTVSRGLSVSPFVEGRENSPSFPPFFSSFIPDSLFFLGPT